MLRASALYNSNHSPRVSSTLVGFCIISEMTILVVRLFPDLDAGGFGLGRATGFLTFAEVVGEAPVFFPFLFIAVGVDALTVASFGPQSLAAPGVPKSPSPNVDVERHQFSPILLSSAMPLRAMEAPAFLGKFPLFQLTRSTLRLSPSRKIS